MSVRQRMIVTARLAVLGLALHAEQARAAEPRYLGVASCSSSTCHGAIVTREGGRVEQNEYRVWSQKDRHSRAYAALSTEESRLIATRLGLDSATKAPACLACHSMQIPEDRQDPGFEVKDGVGCEACHGAASGWIRTHYAVGVSHQKSVDNGLIKLEDPATRARTCMPCHQGGSDRGVTHQMMAAGHPRLSFELDTFTHLQPTHFKIDDDYHLRKTVTDSATAWAVGQAVSVDSYLSMLTRRVDDRNAAWPDFALYDCFSCHHAIGTQLADSGPAPGRELGLPRLALPALPLYRALVELSGPKAAAELDRATNAIRQAGVTGGAELQRESAALAELARRDTKAFADRRFENKELLTLLANISSPDRVRDYRTYADAEQATMACQALAATIADPKRKALPENRATALANAVQGLFAATESEETFRAARFQEAMAKLRRAL